MRKRDDRQLEQTASELETQRQWTEAADAYRRAIKVRPGRARLWYRLARVLHAQRDWIGAAEAYRHAIVLTGGSARLYFRLGSVLERTGELRQARAAYRAAEGLEAPVPSIEGEPGHSLPYARRIDLGLLPKPGYAHLTLRAAQLAARLDLPRISILELGVAGGNGLLAMEQHAADVEAMTDIGIDVYGFDTGEGLYAPQDHRDLPYLFAEGNYAIDVEALRARLTRAELVLGDASATLPRLLADGIAPIGAISFDMDLYSATRSVLDVLGSDVDERRFLPRVRTYFDDVLGKGEQDYNEYTGELLAIEEFNQECEQTKVAEDRYFRTLPLNFAWHHRMYVMHRFAHPDYGTYVSAAGPESLSLRE